MGTAYQLRAVRPGDAAAVLEAFVSAPDMARQGEVTDLASARDYLRWLLAEGRHAWAVDLGGRMVGLVGVSVDVANRSGWVFYWMHAHHRGRGVTARAVDAAVRWGFTTLAVDRVELVHAVDNPASGRVAEKAGFALEGRLRRSHRYGDGVKRDELLWARLADDDVPELTSRS